MCEKEPPAAGGVDGPFLLLFEADFLLADLHLGVGKQDDVCPSVDEAGGLVIDVPGVGVV